MNYELCTNDTYTYYFLLIIEKQDLENPARKSAGKKFMI